MFRKIPFIFLVFTVFFVARLTAEVSSPLFGKVIVVDPGHGAKNRKGRIVNAGCASPSGYLERDRAVVIGETLGRQFLLKGATVYFTRDKNNFWRIAETQKMDNKTRAEFANNKNADIFIRIHLNWSPDKKHRGALVLWYKEDSRGIAALIAENIKQKGVILEGVRKQHLVGFEFAKVPAVLVEYGYLSNKEDEQLIKSDDYAAKISSSIVDAVEKYFKDKN
ncbi:MAG: N-acetylmuramoyl-L-alanine amidase LytC precursor [Elusimicrobia bacterium ADurb.Bin231]|nr:MAG: N-acetylmuramoyl-L-alanine amidase LytC precursor [Elusimicrobia bacterium ADurb.Bin231]